MSVEWEGPGWAGLVLSMWGMCLFGLTFSSPGKEVQRLGPGHLDGKAGLEAAGPMEERREAGEGTQGGWGPRGSGGPGRRGGRAEAEGRASFCIHAQCPASNSNCYQGTGAREKDDKRDARGGGKRSLGKGVKARERARNSGGEWTVLGTERDLKPGRLPDQIPEDSSGEAQPWGGGPRQDLGAPLRSFRT